MRSRRTLLEAVLPQALLARVPVSQAPLARVLLALVGLWLWAGASSARAEEMTFQSVRMNDPAVCGGACPNAIAATGQITQNTAGRFVSFLQSQGGASNTTVFLNSPGGSVLGSMEFGTLLRHLGATAVVGQIASDGQGGAVAVNGECFSACVYTLIGARRRIVPSRSLVGIHRMFLVEEGVDANGTTLVRHRRSDNGDMRSVLMQYSSQMGVNPGLIAAAERTPSSTLKILSQGEMRHWRLASSAY